MGSDITQRLDRGLNIIGWLMSGIIIVWVGINIIVLN